MERSAGKGVAHHLRENLEVAVFAIVMAMGLKVFAVEAYQIPTGSMQPALMGTALLDPMTRGDVGGLHDRVLVDKVSYWFREPRRWEVIVFRYPLAAHANYVKRLGGLPNEQLKIEYGDLWARPLGSEEDFGILRKPWNVQQAVWKNVLPPPATDAGAWTGWQETGALRRSGDGGILLEGAAEVAHEHRIKDDPMHGYPDAIVFQVPNMNAQARHVVSDLRWEFEVVPHGPRGALKAIFDFGPHAVTLSLGADGDFEITGPSSTRSKHALALREGEPLAVDLAFWDQTLRCEVRGAGEPQVYQFEFELEPAAALRNGARFITDAGGWELRPVHAWRDIHYLPPRQTGTTAVFDVAPGHYFMLGDNTQNSLDSRDWTAEVLEFDGAAAGVARARGDRMSNGQDPMMNNPRLNQANDAMTFRDEFGNLHAWPIEVVRGARSDLLEAAPLVPREHLLGRVLAVFLPVRPFSPVNRFGWVR